MPHEPCWVCQGRHAPDDCPHVAPRCGISGCLLGQDHPINHGHIALVGEPKSGDSRPAEGSGRSLQHADSEVEDA